MSVTRGACLVLERGVCFIPILKNASGSIGQAMAQQHAVESNFVRTPKVLNDNISVAVLRDPVSRFISAYNYLGWAGDRTPQEVLEGPADVHFTPQAWFLPEHVDMLYRFDDLDTFAYRIKLRLPHNNPGTQDRFSQHETPELIRSIEQYYARDYELYTEL